MKKLVRFAFVVLAVWIGWSSPFSAQTSASEDAPVAIPEHRLAVDTARAVSLFDAICGASLPSFSSANKRALKLDFIARSREFFVNKFTKNTDFTAESPTDDLGVYVTLYPGGKKTCTINYRSNETAKSYKLRLAPVLDVAEFEKTGKWPNYRGSKAIFSASTSANRDGGRLKLQLTLTVQ